MVRFAESNHTFGWVRNHTFAGGKNWAAGRADDKLGSLIMQPLSDAGL